MTPEDFLATAQSLAAGAQARGIAVTLEKNDVGNLNIVGEGDLYLGYVDLRTGEVVWWDKDREEE